MRIAALTVSTALALTPLATADDLFVIDATGGGNTVRLGSSSLIDLVDDAINTRNQFAPFENTDATFRLRYGNVADAITVSKNAGNTQATLRLITGFERTFTGANQNDLENQIEDFLKKDGGTAVREFLKAMNERSVIAVSDGNPLATTARMANAVYERFGLNADQFRGSTILMGDRAAEQSAQGASTASENAAIEPTPTRTKAPAQFRIRVSAGRADADGFTGNTLDADLGMLWNFSERVGLSLGLMLGAQQLEDATVFHLGFSPALPIRLAIPDDTSPWSWQITPFGSGGGSGSVDIGAGGLITGGGIANHLAYRFSDRFSLHMGNQIAFYRGNTLKFRDYELNPGVSQTILKNGLQARFNLGETPADALAGRWSIYAGASYTQMLDDAAVDSWVSPGAGFQVAWGAASSLQIGFTGDIASNYKVYGGRIAWNIGF